jgi:hypothetical protein
MSEYSPKISTVPADIQPVNPLRLATYNNGAIIIHTNEFLIRKEGKRCWK